MLFCTQLDREAIDDIRLAVNQGQALGNSRFHAKIKQMVGLRREALPRGWPRGDGAVGGTVIPGQGELFP